MGEKGKIAIKILEERRMKTQKIKRQKYLEDDNKNLKNIQKLTDLNIENIDKILTEKEKEISQI